MKIPANNYLSNAHRFFYIFALCSFLLLQSAQSSISQTNRWFFVGTDSREAKVFLDKTSVDESVNGFFAWGKIVFSDGSYTINRSGWDCENKQHLIVTSKIYDSRGGFIKTVTGRNVWSYITPDSVAESLYNTICQSYVSDSSSSSDRETVRVVSKMANVRESPSMDAAVVGKASKGKVFELVNPEPKNGWYKIYFKLISSSLETVAPNSFSISLGFADCVNLPHISFNFSPNRT